MKFFKLLIAVFKTYGYWDYILSGFAFAVILLMIVKMMLFPYGFFDFGKPNIYTEGLVAKNGIQNLNPLFIDYNEADREISSLIFSGLMKYDPSKKAVVDDLANLTINEDKTQYTLKLRKGIFWHDGAPVTIEDVYFTFHDMVMAKEFPNQILKANFDGIEIEKTAEDTIKFTLQKPNIFFINNLTIGILPQHLLKDVKPADLLKDDFNKTPIGTGPYMVTDPAEKMFNGRYQITLERNSKYYAEIPVIEYMRFLVYPNMEELLEEVNAVNGVVKVSGKYVQDFKNNKRFELLPYKLPQYTAVFMNMDSPILKEGKVRLALQKALDKSKLTKDSFDKAEIDTPLLELDQKDWVYQANVDEAKGALKEAGYSYGPEDVNQLGIRYDSEGKALQLTLLARLYDQGSYQYEETKKLIDFLQQSWEAIGFDIKIELFPEDQFEGKIMNREYDLLLVGHSLGYNMDTYSYWHSAQATALGQNFSNYKSFQVDSLIEDIRSVFNVEKRDKELKMLADQIKKDIPAIFLYQPQYYYATDGKIAGISMENVVFPNDRFFSVASWVFTR